MSTLRILVAHGVAKHQRGTAQERVANGLVRCLARGIGAVERVRIRVAPLPDEGASVMRVDRDRHDGTRWTHETTIADVYESYWSAIARSDSGFAAWRKDIGFANASLPHIFALLSYATPLTFLADAATIVLFLCGLVILGASAALLGVIFGFYVLIVSKAQTQATIAITIQLVVTFFAIRIVRIVLANIVERLRVNVVPSEPDFNARTAPGAPGAARAKRFYAYAGARINEWLHVAAFVVNRGVFVLLVLLLAVAVGHGTVFYATAGAMIAYVLIVVGRDVLSLFTDRFRDLRVYLAPDTTDVASATRERILAALIRDLERRTREDAGEPTPIVVVGHSLGGQVVLDALIDLADAWEASGDPERRERARMVVTNISAVVLTGAPVALLARFATLSGITRIEQRRRAVLRSLFDGTWQGAPEGFTPPRLVNVWSVADPFSGPIAHLVPSARDVRVRGLGWLAAHNAYFSSPRYWRDTGLLDDASAGDS